ncbi:DNA alkylation repair protein [Calditrichota bacterium]
MKPHQFVLTIREGLKSSANHQNAVPMQIYMKSEMPYRGVKSPQQKKIFQSSSKNWQPGDLNEYLKVIEQLWDAEYREERYAAIFIAQKYKKFQTLEALLTYRMMIKTGAWWDYVDAIASHLIGSLLQNYPDNMKPLMYEWIEDEDVWIRRTALLCQLKFKAETDQQMLFDFCRKRLGEESFWIRKAIGWALREYSKSKCEEVSRFVEKQSHKMSGLTLREASKYL